MPRANPAEHLEKLKNKRTRLDAQIARAAARKREAARKLLLKRKILAGGMVLDRLERGELPENLFLRDMDRYLVRDGDRALFDLPPRPPKED